MPFEHEDHYTRRKPPKIVSLGLIILGGAAVVVPIVLLRRVQTGRLVHNAKSLGNAPPPPIRRSSLQSKSNVSLSRLEGSIMASRLPGSSIVAHKVTNAHLPSVNEHTTQDSETQSDPLHALKAFGIATCIVSATAAVGVWAVRWSMDVQSIEQFAAKMRANLQSVAPVLSARIYRSLVPSDSSPVSPLGLTTMQGSDRTMAPSEEPDDDTTNWGDASDRLSQAFEEGGLAKWFEVVGREMEREAHTERERRSQALNRTAEP